LNLRCNDLNLTSNLKTEKEISNFSVGTHFIKQDNSEISSDHSKQIKVAG